VSPTLYNIAACQYDNLVGQCFHIFVPYSFLASAAVSFQNRKTKIEKIKIAITNTQIFSICQAFTFLIVANGPGAACAQTAIGMQRTKDYKD
jgi:hypothetical protein